MRSAQGRRAQNDTARLVILNPSTVTLSPSSVILNEVKNLRAGSAKSLRTSSVKDLWQTDPLPKRPQSPATLFRLQLIRNPGQQVRECLRQTDGLGERVHRSEGNRTRTLNDKQPLRVDEILGTSGIELEQNEGLP